jgi:toxin secretion/phage lysis holin
VSFTQKTVTAKEANNSLARKVGMIILMLMVGYLSRLVAFDFPLVDALGGFFIYNETLSILENATILGVPIPQWLRDALERISPQGKIATNARLYGARRATDEVNTQPPKSRRS